MLYVCVTAPYEPPEFELLCDLCQKKKKKEKEKKVESEKREINKRIWM